MFSSKLKQPLKENNEFKRYFKAYKRQASRIRRP